MDGSKPRPRPYFGKMIHVYPNYHLVMTNIAMENPEKKWRYRSLGKSSISIRAMASRATRVDPSPPAVPWPGALS
jgi:hypothetical protein